MTTSYEQAFHARKHIPKKEALKLKPGTFIRLKWLDAPDSIAILAEKLDYRQKGDVTVEYVTEFGYGNFAVHEQIVEVLGKVEWPALALGPKVA